MNATTPTTSLGFLRHELEHMRSHWLWFVLLGALLATCGTLALIFPAAMVGTSLAVPILLGVLLMIGGVATIVGAFWAGKWSGFVLQLLVGILYLTSGFLFTEKPVEGAYALTFFIAVSFIVMGILRTVAALVLQFPQWGWALLNGVVTLLAGVVIFRNLPQDTFWVIGLLIGLEMIFNGWAWMMLGLALRSLHVRPTA